LAARSAAISNEEEQPRETGAVRHSRSRGNAAFLLARPFHQDELKLNLRSFPPIERNDVPLKILAGSREREGCAAR
jgi:hypothetical protein